MGKEIDPELLRKLLRYEPETGKLFWLPRTPDLFHDTTDRRGVNWCCQAWNGKNAGREAFTANSAGYRMGAVFGRNYGAHRVAWALTSGSWPKMIDHINGDRSDNRLANLRSVSRLENQRNMKRGSDNKSGQTGVGWDSSRDRWVAAIGVGGRTDHIGRFDKKADAIAARKQAERDFGFHPNHGRAA